MSTVMEMDVTNPVERNIDDEEMPRVFYSVATWAYCVIMSAQMPECSDGNWLQLERQKSANSINAILVISTVNATVTFTFLMAGLPTGGGTAGPVPWFNQPEHVIGLYIIVTSLSFTVSVLSLIVGINGLIISSKTLEKEVQLLRKSVSWASRLMFIAIFCLVLAMSFEAMSTFHVMVPHRHIVTQIFAGFSCHFSQR